MVKNKLLVYPKDTKITQYFPAGYKKWVNFIMTTTR